MVDYGGPITSHYIQLHFEWNAPQEKCIPGDKKPFKFNAHEILARAAAKFSVMGWDFMSLAGCRERIFIISREVTEFVEEMRLKEDVPPQSQILEKSATMSAHNKAEHDLAMARLQHSVCSQRVARYAAWAFQQSAAMTLVRSAVLGEDEISTDAQEITTFKPACLIDTDGNRLYQVVTFRNPVTEQIEPGLVHGVWRGALSRIAQTAHKGAGVTTDVPRKLRVAKAVTHELDVRLTARLRIVLLERLAPGSYTCSCLSPSVVVDPVRKVSSDPREANAQLQLKVVSADVHMNQYTGLRTDLHIS